MLHLLFALRENMQGVDIVLNNLLVRTTKLQDVTCMATFTVKFAYHCLSRVDTDALFGRIFVNEYLSRHRNRNFKSLNE